MSIWMVTSLAMLVAGLVWFDQRTRRIPNGVTLPLLGIFMLLHWPGAPETWLGCLLLFLAWQSGWLGNMWIHYSSEQQRGLCYEWKYLVHEGVADTVKAVGWQIRGIARNENKPREHHAVVIFDPKQVDSADLLTASADQPAYVLDAWRQGKADIYHLADWLGDDQEIIKTTRIFHITPSPQQAP